MTNTNDDFLRDATASREYTMLGQTSPNISAKDAATMAWDNTEIFMQERQRRLRERLVPRPVQHPELTPGADLDPHFRRQL